MTPTASTATFMPSSNGFNSSSVSSPITYSIKFSNFSGFPMPTRIRLNLSVPKQYATDFAPLCFPGLPFCLIRILPGSTSISS